jgi:hypothetical protein
MKETTMAQDLTSYNGRIAYLSGLNSAVKYLEIGVAWGTTFFSVDMPFKIAVDPHFNFDPLDHTKNGTHFFQITSDEFFRKLDDDDLAIQDIFIPKPFTFDVIFIDGLHTFEQSYRDFKNSLRYAHNKTLWLIDDTTPCDAYSAIPDQEVSLYKRGQAGLDGIHWHGDVYKTVLAIHDYYPEISYCTLMGGNPQTILWKAKASDRKPMFSSITEINSLSFYDMLRYAKCMMPINYNKLPEYIFRSLNPADDAAPDSWKRIVTADHEARIQELNVLLEDREARIQELLHSRSWRLTAPLRSLSHFVRNF